MQDLAKNDLDENLHQANFGLYFLFSNVACTFVFPQVYDA